MVRVSNPTMSFGEVMQMSEVISQSGFFKGGKDDNYRPRSKEQIATIIWAGLELGLTSMQAVRELQFIKGKLCLPAVLIAALVRSSERYEYAIIEHTNTRCVLRFFDNGETITPDVTFDISDARTAGLLGGEGYQKYPKNMLFARAMTNGARWYCADVFSGSVYTPEELSSTDAQSLEGPATLALVEKTITHYDGLLSNGKDPESYSSPQLISLLTSPKPTARDKELLQAVLDKRKASEAQAIGDAQSEATSQGMDLHGASEVEARDVGQTVRTPSSDSVSAQGGAVGQEGVAHNGGHGDSSKPGKSGKRVGSRAASLRPEQKRHGEWPAISDKPSKEP